MKSLNKKLKIESSEACELLTSDQYSLLLQDLPCWSIVDQGKCMMREYQFDSFSKVMSFVNMVAWVAENHCHHPSINISYRNCCVKFTTYSVGGLTIKDYNCATKIDELFE